MGVKELNRRQLVQLKAKLISDRNYEIGVGTSYLEYANADELVSDEEAYREFDGYIFSPDDFF